VLDGLLAELRYVELAFDDTPAYGQLRQALEELDEAAGEPMSRAFYLSTAPEFFPVIVEALGAAGLAEASEPDVDVRCIIEKPFGTSLQEARDLNRQVLSVFQERQIFRIDHYLGKETVQNILVFRFGNGIFEPVWNRNYIDHVEITAAESIGIEGRGPFYEKAGALRDVVQNHVMELLSFVAMEPPVSFEADAVRGEKVKVWKAIKPIPIEDTVRGQYGPGVVGKDKVIGYREEERVDPNSVTETFAAIKLEIENWRWAGVPFYIRAGKRMAKRTTDVTVVFKQPPMRLFNESGGGPCDDIHPNLITMRIQPDEGISLRFGAKVPSTGMSVCPVIMDFSYAAAFGSSSANGYERLLLDAMLGDATLFAHRDGVEATWSLYTPVLEAWLNSPQKGFPNYASGTWGPEAADELLRRDGREWQKV
jgi:glucose-6-phosphate 1-dehydrogenase